MLCFQIDLTTAQTGYWTIPHCSFGVHKPTDVCKKVPKTRFQIDGLHFNPTKIKQMYY